MYIVMDADEHPQREAIGEFIQEVYLVYKPKFKANLINTDSSESFSSSNGTLQDHQPTITSSDLNNISNCSSANL